MRYTMTLILKVHLHCRLSAGMKAENIFNTLALHLNWTVQACDLFFFFFFVTCFFCSLSGLKAKSKTESLDPKKQKKLEKEEKDFRKKFKVCFHFSVSFSDSILIM